MKHLTAFAVLGLALGFAAPAGFAQTVQTAQPPIAEPAAPASPADEVVHVQGPRRADEPVPGPQRAAMRFRPGGQLLKSFDANQDGVITRQELAAGAAAAFDAADANQDGVVGGIEQTAWAQAYGGINDVLSNAMLFDSNLDHMVTRDEFIMGVMRLAEPAKDSTGGVQVSKLLIAERPEDRPLPPPEAEKVRPREQQGG